MFSYATITAKATELCKDIEILSQTFERIVDRKDAIIKSLSQDLAEAEEQYQLALRFETCRSVSFSQMTLLSYYKSLLTGQWGEYCSVIV